MAADPRRSWDLFCRRVDNFGDVGVSWRLAAGLASRGHRVRLWVDDPSPLRFMAPAGAAGVEVLDWPAEFGGLAGHGPGDVVIETFGCELPACVVEAMTARQPAPVWLNLEYLSAEDYAERSHGLPSPQPSGLAKWFFFPGFSPGTGGLLREPGLLEQRAAFDREAWLAGRGIARRADERVVLLFGYAHAQLASLIHSLGDRPTLLLLAQGPARQQVEAMAGQLPARLRCTGLPWLTQAEFDRALWCADLNLVRGEDSLVRAIWAGAPLVWQLYPQEPEVLERKLAAWLGRLCAGTPSPALHDRLQALHRRYNGLDGSGLDAHLVWPDESSWRAQMLRWRASLAALPDLVTQLERFVNGKS